LGAGFSEKKWALVRIGALLFLLVFFEGVTEKAVFF
jgi:hypothetical protein